MNVEFQMVGHEQLRAALTAMAQETPKRVGAALYREAKLVEGRSRELTPVKTGALRGSHHTDEPVYALDGNVTCVVRVGGNVAPYAVVVHEDLSKHHRPPTRAKFLETAYLERQGLIITAIAQRVGLV